MNGRHSRFGRREWSFRLWAYRSGERVCTANHDTPTMRARAACPTCKAVV